MRKVFVAMSGGVDSSVAAALLREGYDCEGVFMVTHDGAGAHQADAERVAETLGIRLHVLDLRDRFGAIIGYFCDEYARGRTPNPCVLCNREVKFGLVLEYARSKGADFLATGHYARLTAAGPETMLCEALDETKDQSYVLAMVRREALRHVLLPMGAYRKSQTRAMAAQLGIHVENKADSQEICFIPDNDRVGFMERHRPGIGRQGRVVDAGGRVLGEHGGIYRYTIGQRRGVRVAMGKPAYVVGLDAATNTVVLGAGEELLSTGLKASGVNWLIDEPQGTIEAWVKIRYNHRGCEASVRPDGSGRVRADFAAPAPAVTPGQTAVFYVRCSEGLRVAGGGWIDEAVR